MRIIFDINLFFLREVEARFPNDRDRLRRMSIIEEGSVQMVRMAFLAVVGSHTVNGVARIHSGLVRSKVRIIRSRGMGRARMIRRSSSPFVAYSTAFP